MTQPERSPVNRIIRPSDESRLPGAFAVTIGRGRVALGCPGLKQYDANALRVSRLYAFIIHPKRPFGELALNAIHQRSIAPEN